MKISFPHTIENCLGEKIIFKGLENGPQGEKVIVESYVTPGNGPLMHTHFLQDEQLTVLNGTIGYEIPGQDFQYATVGDTVVFKRGTPHRFWNAGDDILVCEGEVNP